MKELKTLITTGVNSGETDVVIERFWYDKIKPTEAQFYIRVGENEYYSVRIVKKALQVILAEMERLDNLEIDEDGNIID